VTEDHRRQATGRFLRPAGACRNRLMWALGAFFIAFLVCFSFFAKPLFNLSGPSPLPGPCIWAGMTDRKIELIYTAPQEFFFTQIKIRYVWADCVLAFR